jgi:hypothetical protein
VAVSGLLSKPCRRISPAAELVPVRVEDHASVLRLLSRRHTQLGWSYNKTACRLHALLAELVPGGIRKEVVVSQARSLLEDHQPIGAVAIERHLLAVDLVDDSTASTASGGLSASGSPSPSLRQARRSRSSSASVT